MLTEVNLIVLNNNMLQYIAALSLLTALEVQIFKNFVLSKLNVKHSCQTHQLKTNRLSPDSHKTQTLPDPLIGTAI
jgi:hypothetical protein